MTENTPLPAIPRKVNLKIVLPILMILALLLIYGAGFIALPIGVLTSLRNSDCKGVISWNKVYTSLYPSSIRDQTLPAPVRECEVYLAAVSLEEQGTWREAYNAYQTYATTYPTGLYIGQVREHSALVLMNAVHDEVEANQHEQALADLNLILTTYTDSSVAAEAWTLVPQVYISWGTAFRDAADFERAEQVFNEFKAWTQTNQKTELETEARRELAKTYLGWGLVLQEHKQYETALSKLDQAIAADPQSQFESAAEVRSAQQNIYVEWGNVFLGLGEFPTAIEKFNKAVSLSDGKTEDGTRDALSNGHIQWAASLSSAADFHAALEHLNLAKDAAQTDPAKQTVDKSFSDMYLAFSQSTEIQARAAIREGVDAICKKNKKPEFPIFGLNKDSVRLGISGDDAKLPEELTAKTPGEMHYVMCVNVENKTVDSREQQEIVYKTSKWYLYRMVTQTRVQLIWKIQLFNADTGELVAETTLNGGAPPPFPEGAGGGSFAGPAPTDAEISKWLDSVIK